MRSLTLKFRTHGEESVVLRKLMDAYLQVVGQVDVMKRECRDDDLDNLHTLAGITDHCHDRIEQFARRTRRVAALLAQEELESSDCEVMAHGCAAPLPAVGPAPEAGQSRAVAHPADPLFLDHERQELPELAGSGPQNTTLGVAQL